MTFLKRPLAYLLTLLILGCANSSVLISDSKSGSPGGIGGTGILHDQNGIGGTGKTVDEGIGGTGRVASGIGGTGIVGTITGFGSIWVNNAHVHFDDSTAITINQAPATSGELQLGQVVAVNSHPDGEEYQAKTIDIIHEVVGPISHLSLDERSLEVLNQSIKMDADAILYDQKTASEIPLDHLKTGAYIEVSGLRQESGDIVASRLDIVEQVEEFQLIGELKQNETGHWQINDQNIQIDELLLFDGLDKRTLVSGHLEGEILVAEAIGSDSIETVLEDVSEIIYEGYVFDMNGESTLNIGGLEFTLQDTLNLTSDLTEDRYSDAPIQINAILAEDGLYEAQDIMIEVEQNGHFPDVIPHEEIEHQEQDVIDDGAWQEEIYYDEGYADENSEGGSYEDTDYGEESETEDAILAEEEFGNEEYEGDVYENEEYGEEYGEEYNEELIYEDESNYEDDIYY